MISLFFIIDGLLGIKHLSKLHPPTQEILLSGELPIDVLPK